MIKRLAILMVVLASPLVIGLLITYEVIKIDWISFMEMQPSFKAQEAPLPLPKESIPVEGASNIEELGAPVNPVAADEGSIGRGGVLYDTHCALCHGKDGKGTGTFVAFLIPRKPANLLEGNALTGSDGAMFLTMSQGVEGAMPALRENLTVMDRWDVVNYVRSLQGK
jgi:mono/diheme cytochrome c family protein